MTRLSILWKDDEAATAVEYGLILALIAGIIVAIVTTVGQQVRASFQGASSGFPGP